jgi:hypothetical protein
MWGWGVSLGVSWAFDAVDAVIAHNGDLGNVAVAYAEAVMPDAEAYYRESACQDRIRIARRRGEEIADADREEVERQMVLDNGLMPGMFRDMDILRAMLRRINLIDHPDEIWTNEPVIARAREIAAWRAEHRKAESGGPTRDELLAVIAEADRRGPEA